MEKIIKWIIGFVAVSAVLVVCIYNVLLWNDDTKNLSFDKENKKTGAR